MTVSCCFVCQKTCKITGYGRKDRMQCYQFKDKSGLFLIIVGLIIVAILTMSHANFAHHLPYRDLGNTNSSKTTYIGARSSGFPHELNNMNHLKCLSLNLT